MSKILLLRSCLAVLGLALATPSVRPAAAQVTSGSELETGYRLIYELEFAPARAQFAAWEKTHPQDPLGPASEAASYLYEEFYQQGVFTSEFFLNDKKLLGGVDRPPDPQRKAAFLAANQRAQQIAQARLKTNPKDAEALFAMTIVTGMQADFTTLIEKRQLEGLALVRKAETEAGNLLALKPDDADAYLALGAANYIIGCLPGYKRLFLWFGGIRGDRERGMQQLQIAASRGHYLRPFAKVMLALAAEREHQPQLAEKLFRELVAEFPENRVFTRELARLEPPPATANPH
jgi:hypothetical protein